VVVCTLITVNAVRKLFTLTVTGVVTLQADAAYLVTATLLTA